ncbi:SUF system FeS assembly protein, NifU family [Peptostreptococcaceae bacterium oral taxon 113 str. W5053]|nr:SUF system FeS assembly protein, NifU family [Peptostreptococcaceae bacterium oral taxon 113 str. W5053]
MNEIYTQLILEQSRNKRNRRELENPTLKELGHNPSCGDEITLQVNLDRDAMKDLAYTGQGCAISQASTSIMIDTVKGMATEEAIALCDKFIGMIKGEITDEDQLEDLGDAVAFENIRNMPARVKCAVLPWYTLKAMLEKRKEETAIK